MRVQTEEWRRFIPGVRMYKGKKTLFWNGEPLLDSNWEKIVYDEEERDSWEVIIVLPGVEMIPYLAFCRCSKIEAVIMADSVRSIEDRAFEGCKSLVFVKLSRNLECIGRKAFYNCKSLTSIYIPPSCREIDGWAFAECSKLIILNVPQHTQLDEKRYIIADTALFEASPFDTDSYATYEDEVNEWIKNRNADDQFCLHRACAAYNPLEEVMFEIVKRQGLKAFKRPDSVGVTPSQYLSENPYTEIKEHKMIKRYILDMMGEVV